MNTHNVHALAIATICATLAAQDSRDHNDRVQSRPLAANTLLPLTKGAKWIYVSRFGGISQATQTFEVWDLLRLPGGRTCAEIRIHNRREDGTDLSFEYWSAQKDGLFQYYNVGRGTTRGVDDTRPARRILPTPVGVETAWQWEEPTSWFPGNQQNRAKGGGFLFEARLLAIDKEITVTGRKFNTVHVRITTAAGEEKITKDLYFATKVGVVKEVLRFGKRVSTRELKSFRPGRKELHEPDRELRRYISTHKPWSDGKPEIRWHSPARADSYFRTRFASVRIAGKTTMFRVHPAGVSPFQLQSAKDWTLLLQAEGLDPDDSAFMVLVTMAALEAARLGLRKIRVGGGGREPGRGGWFGRGDKVSAFVVAIDSKGQARRITATMVVHDNSSITRLMLKEQIEPGRRR